jgi:hypothetical protein
MPPLAGGGAPIVIENYIHLDGKEIYRSTQRQAVTTQRRTGHLGLSKRTR